jgi:acetolactate synthase small subunit
MTGSATPAERHWFFVIRADDRPGSAASIATTFSGRGIQMESFYGFGDSRGIERETGAVIGITFLAFPHRMASVRRVLERLEPVRWVQVYDYEADPRLVKVVLLRVAMQADRALAIAGEGGDVTAQVLDQAAASTGLLLTGRPSEVDAALDRLRREAQVTISSGTLLPPEEGGVPASIHPG